MNKFERRNFMVILFLSFMLAIVSCGGQRQEGNTEVVGNTITNIDTSSPTNLIYKTLSFGTNTPIPTKTSRVEYLHTTPIPIASIPQCKSNTYPEGTVLLTGGSIYTVRMGCQSEDEHCYSSRDIFSYHGWLLDATWSPINNDIFFISDIHSPPMREGVGGLYTEARLFSIPSEGGLPIAKSGRGGFVNQISSCRGVDRILYERTQDITSIYMVDTEGYGSSFSHNGKSVYHPVCSPQGQDILFTTDDDELYIKHVGNSVHRLVSENAWGNAAWSPDQQYIAFSYMESVSKKGTCIALSNIDVNEDPIVIQPCPIPGTGIIPVWSSDGQHIISINLREWNELSDLILLEVPTDISTYMEVVSVPKVILSIFTMIQSTIWIHPNIFLVIDEPLYPDPYKIIVFTIEDNCILQTIDIPRGASEPDWLPA